MGWSYWFAWVVTGIADLVAITGYARFWWPGLPIWVPALVTVALILAVNLFSVRHFGELEFWFALIKVAAIVCLIAVGAILVATNFVSSWCARDHREPVERQRVLPNGFPGRGQWLSDRVFRIHRCGARWHRRG